MADAKTFTEIAQAFHAVAEHCGCDVSEVSKRKWRAARKEGHYFGAGLSAVERLARLVGGWGNLRDRVIAADIDTVPRQGPIVAVPDGHDIRGVSTFVGPDGEVRGQWIKTRATPEDDRLRAVASIVERLPEILGESAAAPVAMPKVNAPDVLAVFGVGDLHVGMRAWCAENGVSWDLETAESVAMGAVSSLVSQGPDADTALLINVGDWHHHDGKGVTPKSGHMLDNAGTWHEIVSASIRTMTGMVSALLRRHKRVHVISAIGNHDMHSTALLNATVDAWFRNDPRVSVDRTSERIHYYQHGRCMFAVTHGDTIKPGKMPLLMATDKPEMWGATKHRYAFQGHVHHERKVEYSGCIVETLKTLAPGDAYARDHGYRSGRDMSRIAYHAEHGEIARSTITASAVEATLAGAA